MLQSVSAVIDALGGTSETANLFGVLPSAVSNWRKTGFPPRLHYRLAKELEGRGLVFDERSFAAAPSSEADQPKDCTGTEG